MSNSFATKLALTAWFTTLPLLVLNAPANAAAEPGAGRVSHTGADDAVVTVAPLDPTSPRGAMSATLALRDGQATFINLPAGRYEIRHTADGPAAVVAGDRVIKLAAGQSASIDLTAAE